MSEESVGTITILLTDLEGSTNLANKRGDEVAQRIHATQDQIVREQLAQFDGLVDDSTGDGLLAVFRSTRKALACAVAIQEWVRRHNDKRPEDAFLLRIGLHTGEVLNKGGKLFGATINAAARITDKAKGGEILTSEIVKQLVGSAPEVPFKKKNRVTLKGFPEKWVLYEVLWQEQSAPAPTTEEPGPRGPVFVGREKELATLEGALKDAFSGRGRCVLLAGEPGIGKTSLADRLCEAARQQGALVAWGRGWEGGGAPAYWPWIQLTRALIEELGPERMLELAGARAGYLAHIVPEVRKLITHTAPVVRATEQDRFALFDATASLMADVAAERPLVLILDDLHATDEASLHLLHFVARGLRTARVLIIGTFIEADMKRSPELARVIAGVTREAEVLHITGLGQDDVARYFEGVTGEAPGKGMPAEIHGVTEGNPLFLDEAVRLVASGGARRPDQSLGFRVPAGARDLTRRRLSPLPEETLKVLAVASVIGREFNFATLLAVSGIDQDRLLGMLTEGIGAGVIEEMSHLGRYRFAHILIRESLYEELTTGDRMRLHREVGETLERIHEGDEEAHMDELAHHFFKAAQAGDVAKTIDYTIRAAKKATNAMAYEEAVRLYTRAQRAAEIGGTGRSRRAELAKLLAEAEMKASGSGEALTAAASGSGQPGQPPSQGFASFTRAGEFWTVSFEGKEVRLKDGKGPRYLSQLLKNPGTEIHVLDLAASLEMPSGGGTPARGGSGGRRRPAREDQVEAGHGDDAGAILDATAKAAYKKRLTEIEEDLAEAEEFNDSERAARLRAEKEALIDQLAAGVGLGGRDRKAASRSEAARSSITKAIKNTLSKLEVHHPDLGRHFAATVKTGVYCSYTPDPRAPLTWQT